MWGSQTVVSTGKNKEAIPTKRTAGFNNFLIKSSATRYYYTVINFLIIRITARRVALEIKREKKRDCVSTLDWSSGTGLVKVEPEDLDQVSIWVS
jgi:hypothetical protein